jgi:endonuclease G, mitochondrial
MIPQAVRVPSQLDGGVSGLRAKNKRVNVSSTHSFPATLVAAKIATPVVVESVATDVVSLNSDASRTLPRKKDLESALQNFEHAKDKSYYDEARDVADQQIYYQDLDPSAAPDVFFKSLSKQLSKTHTNVLPYEPSVHLYPWVDLRPNLQLESIYSSTTIDAIASIKEDYDKAEYWNSIGQMAAMAALAPATASAQIALTTSQYLNCEHVVCQSWFDHSQPMKGDLHHLFSCDPNCNSFRGNRPLADLPGLDANMTACGTLSEGAKSFEPQAGRGAAARATFYFLVRYPKKVDEYDVEDLKTLQRWSEEDPPNLYEKHRNQAIQELQGNRNPFIDHPDWISKVDFSLGVRKRRKKKADLAPPTVCQLKPPPKSKTPD